MQRGGGGGGARGGREMRGENTHPFPCPSRPRLETDYTGRKLWITFQVNETEEPEATRARLAVVYSPVPKNLTVGPASSVTWYFITAIATSLDTKFAPLSEATRHFIEAKR